jgi:hypothetical protein
VSGVAAAAGGAGVQLQVSVTLGTASFGSASYVGYRSPAFSPSPAGSISTSTFKGAAIDEIANRYDTALDEFTATFSGTLSSGFVRAAVIEKGDGTKIYSPVVSSSSAGGYTTFVFTGTSLWAAGDATEVHTVLLIG